MFRSEAIEAQKQKLHGDVFLTQPLPFSLITLAVAGIVFLVFFLLLSGSYARSEHVTGHLVPSKGLVKLQASQFGTLAGLHIREGDFVTTGQALASILISQNTPDGDSPTQKALDAIFRQKTTLQTQMTLEQNQLETETARLASERAEAALRIASLDRQIQLQEQITASAESAYMDVQELLERGYISKIESERRRQTWLSQQNQEQLKQQERAEAQANLDRLNIRLEQLPNESRQRLARLRSQQSELDAKQAELEGRRAYAVTSPVDGKVVSISSAGVGRSVAAGQPLLTILPRDSHLEAELFIPSRAAGFVEEGQEVRLLYDAFPYQRFGSFPATITQVTESILSPEEVLAPFAVTQPVYRVKAAIGTDSIDINSRRIALQSGMTLQANIILERRSFLDWLLDPLRAVGDRS
ncbi:membrane fusion protein [Eilatimonas milleporae]|uniref:Membrane fusion protein n=2 Tax=Eilatimonas milleporae TaxID=911205 RepID=A0A3M0CWU7_9PROT|nr:membrane fusion protein [Eilatimonas milleporae]